MKALSIRQPWAWLILHAGKDIENRAWRTRFRGVIAVHAAKGMTQAEYDDVAFMLGMEHMDAPSRYPRIELPPARQLERGGIVGTVEVVDCVDDSPSPWFYGPHGLLLRNPQPLPFLPLRGSLGFFDVPDLGGS